MINITNFCFRLYNDFRNNIINQILVLLMLVALFIFFAYNNVFFEIINDIITISTLFSFICLFEIYYYHYNKFKLLNITIYSILSNILLAYYYLILNDYNISYLRYISNYSFLYVYTFALKGIGVCQYKIQTLWIEQITFFIIMAFLTKYALYIIFNLKKFDKSILTHFKFNIFIILSYLIFSGYFTSVLRNINVYFDEELYKRNTYIHMENIIYEHTSEPSLHLDTRNKALRNFNEVYNKPNNNFTKLINYIYKIPDE